MPLFVCDKCGCVENTATSSYWARLHEGDLEKLCSECDTGKWHGRFPKKQWDGITKVKNRG